MPPTSSRLPLPLLRALPFVVLGTLGLAFLVGDRVVSSGPITPPEPEGSVKIEASLERTQLMADQSQDAWARVVLEGAKTPAMNETPPISLTLIIDTSGSMSGEKIVAARESAVAALEQLKAGDRASVIAFSSGADVLARDFRVGSSDFEGLRQRILSLPAAGGTDMVSALAVGGEQALALGTRGRTNRILLLSDGQPDTEAGLKERVQELARQSVLTTTLGIGRDYNEDLMASLADAGLGHYYFVEHAGEMTRIFHEELDSLAAVVAREATLEISGLNGAQPVEVIGYPSRTYAGRLIVPVGDLYSERKADMLVRLRVPASQGEKTLLQVRVSYADVLQQEKVITAQREAAASFVNDANAVAASAVPAVVEKTERVRTARALEEAAQAYAQGDKATGQRILQNRKAQVRSYRKQAKGAFKDNAGKLEAELDGFEQAAEAPAADMKKVNKRYKAKARSWKKH